jgi:hypothetical protein
MSTYNVQGTKTWITAVPATAWATPAAAVTALKAGKQALCTQALGDLVRTRAITEYSCIDTNSSSKSAGKMSYGDFDIELLFDPLDVAGQDALFDAMEANTPVAIGFESPYASGTNGVMVYTNAYVAGDTISRPVDGLVGYKVTVAPYGGYFRCPAAP